MYVAKFDEKITFLTKVTSFWSISVKILQTIVKVSGAESGSNWWENHFFDLNDKFLFNFCKNTSMQ